MDNPVPAATRLEGYLFKWTNYVKGYQKRFFVLENGLISYYRNQAEVLHTCRGTINLVNATIESQDNLHIIISKHGMQTFHLKAANDIDYKKWLQALKNAKARAISFLKPEHEYETAFDLLDESENGEDELISAIAYGRYDGIPHIERILSNLDLKINSIENCQKNLAKKYEEFNRSYKDIESIQDSENSLKKLETFREKASIFNVSSLAVLNSCKSFTQHSQMLGRRWKRIYNSQKDNQQRLDGMVEDLAKQLTHLENKLQQKHTYLTSPNGEKHRKSCPGIAIPVIITDKESSNSPPITTEDSDDEEAAFYDAQETFSVTLPSLGRSRESLVVSGPEAEAKLVNEPIIDDESDISIDFDPDVEDEGERSHKRKKFSKKTKQVKVMTTRSNRSATLTPFNKRIITEEILAEKPSSEIPIISIRNPVHRRNKIPPRPNYSLNLWSIMKNCIGKELSKIPMPVNFSEPISMLQRLTEDFEYSYLLDRAASCNDSTEALAYIAAFTVSSYASTAIRTNKPFNPILGETFEYDRTDDLGWRSLAEQISHHPPKAALHCESNLWESWFDFSMTSKFRGKYLQIHPIGTCHLLLRKYGHHFTWHKIPMTVHNIIVGKLWIDNSGEMDIVNHQTHEKCHLSYSAYSFFSNETPKRVKGAITNANGELKYVLNGTWDQFIDCSEVISSSKDRSGKETVTTGSATRLWEARPNPIGAETMYNFSEFALTLNDPSEQGVAPTDSRLRPDQKLMEAGRWDEANAEKVRLEEKQRERRRQQNSGIIGKDNWRPNEFAATCSSPEPKRNPSLETIDATEKSNIVATDDSHHKPLWFETQVDPNTRETVSIFTKTYWKCKESADWSKCPDLY